MTAAPPDDFVPIRPNPFIVGNAAILRYLTTAEECAKAGYVATSKLAGTSSR